MSLLTLPNELIFRISWFLQHCPICSKNHISRDTSALARSNRHLYAVLTPEIMRVTSPLQILIWGISKMHQETITFAINHGADINAPLGATRSFPRISRTLLGGTPIQIAIRLRSISRDATSHERKLNTIRTLLHAGGNPTIMSLTLVVHRGDLDLLELCLPYITDINERHPPTGRTLLEIAGERGYVQAVTLLLGAGAAANSTGGPDSPGYYPPLWTLCKAPVSVLQLLIDAGADAAWEHDGISIVTHLQQTCGTGPDVDGQLDLLAWHGSRMPKGEEGIALWQAPVWESWTVGEGAEVVERVLDTQMVSGRGEYRGWDWNACGRVFD